MDPLSAILAFTLAAALLTITPGIDTALVLRTAAVDGPRHAMQAGLGITLGVLAWGLIAALGLGAILSVSEAAYRAIQIGGAIYLLWLGGQMLRTALRRGSPLLGADTNTPAPAQAANWFRRGLITNILNPKVGVFYVSFLPQFLPPDMAAGLPSVGFSVLLAGIHAGLSLLWFGLLTVATRPLASLLRRPAVLRGLDGLTGTVLVGFGLKLLSERRL